MPRRKTTMPEARFVAGRCQSGSDKCRSGQIKKPEPVADIITEGDKRSIRSMWDTGVQLVMIAAVFGIAVVDAKNIIDKQRKTRI